MPKLEQVVSVRVSDKKRVDEKRRFTIEIEAPAKLFNISDLMVQERKLPKLSSMLKVMSRSAVVAYVRSGKDIVKGVACGKKFEEVV